MGKMPGIIREKVPKFEEVPAVEQIFYLMLLDAPWTCSTYTEQYVRPAEILLYTVNLLLKIMLYKVK